MSSKENKQKIVLINLTAELTGSLIYSFLFFLFLHRYNYNFYDLSYLHLSFAIGLSYFASIYLPFSTYRIHVFPIVTIVSAFARRNYNIIIKRVPMQLLGAFLGIFLFKIFVNFSSELPSVDQFYIAENTSILKVFLLNMVFTMAIVFLYSYIRFYSREEHAFGFLLIAIMIVVLFLLNGSLYGLSTLNPFGFLFYSLLETNILNVGNLILNLLIHFFSPIFGASAVILLFKKFFGKNFKLKSKPKKLK